MSKQLMHHVTPIAFVVVGLFGLAVIGQYGASIKEFSRTDVGKALTAHPLRITPNKSGLAEFSLDTSSDEPAAVEATAPAGKSIGEPGRVAEINLLMQ